MQALAQRVSSAKICINAKTHSLINEGILAYVCFEKDDNEGVIDRFISRTYTHALNKHAWHTSEIRQIFTHGPSVGEGL